jgi:serine/threonine protein phosphatase PrpC
LLGRLFGPKKKQGGKKAGKTDASREIPTIPVTPPPVKPVAAAVSEKETATLPQLVVGCAQSVGMQRDHNEDAVLILTTLSSNNDGYLPIGLFIIADGMGGHKHGEIASSLAVHTIAHRVMSKVMLPLLDSTPTPPGDPIQEILENSVQEAHRVISKEAPGSGTTLTAVLISGHQMSIAHVGDSRAYAVDAEGMMQVITRDHSLVMRMMELGHLTEEEASVHPQRNVLYRALGQGEPFSPDISTSPLPETGYLLLCTDGLWGVVPQGEMSHIIQTAATPEAACQQLIDAANKAGGPDNISAILVRIPD